LRHESFDLSRRMAGQWIGVLAGPLVWAALLETNYVLSYVACEQRLGWMLHLATAAALTIVASAAVIAWRVAPSLGYDLEREASTNPADTAVIRARFMAMGGLALCAWFAVAIVATDIPAMVLKPCTP
jgi:hypothetical protein